MEIDLHNIREDYSKQSLDIRDCHDNPLEQFRKWLDEAMDAKVNEPTAMNVATVTDNRPTSRVVLLKEVTDEGFIFFTNYKSRKGHSLETTPFAALTFFWPELERSVRIEGSVKFLSKEESNKYFESRPYTSRVGAWASHQSEPLSSKAELMARAAKIAALHPIKVPRPDHWGGYIVHPDRIEFWQGRPSRLHDRIVYIFEDNKWIKERLNP